MKKTFIILLSLGIATLLLTGCYESNSNSNTTASETPIATMTVTPSASTVPTKSPIKEPEQKKYTPMQLVIGSAPKSADVISNIVNDNGLYFYEELVDKTVKITLVAQAMGSDYSPEKSIKNIINTEKPYEFTVSKQPALTKKLSYPVSKIKYLTGKNEDTKQNVAISIPTDDCEYVFIASCPINSYNEYSDLIEVWIESLDLMEL